MTTVVVVRALVGPAALLSVHWVWGQGGWMGGGVGGMPLLVDDNRCCRSRSRRARCAIERALGTGPVQLDWDACWGWEL